MELVRSAIFVKNQWKFYGKTLVACSLLGAFAVSFSSSAEAKRLHDPQMETKVEMHQTLPGGTTVSDLQRRPLKERIQEILNAPPEVEEPVQTAPVPAARVPVTQSVYDASIVGTPLATQQQCVKYLLSVNPYPEISVSPEELVSYYYEEGQREGIRPDVAFAQALKETGFFRYGGTVTPDQNNYCGLGTTSATVKGAYFASSKMGVRAHIQHLLAYASTRTPVEPVVDPRYELVRSVYGERTLDKWQDLNGRWAVPGNSYGQSILSMFRAIVNE
ncbi:MAG: glucosaminidase domain-containing protein [Selenomonadaceae bacterium]|nr:glucosaminidase domain-containing protein [Selenomonadaceae bacterium]